MELCPALGWSAIRTTGDWPLVAMLRDGRMRRVELKFRCCCAVLLMVQYVRGSCSLLCYLRVRTHGFHSERGVLCDHASERASVRQESGLAFSGVRGVLCYHACRVWWSWYCYCDTRKRSTKSPTSSTTFDTSQRLKVLPYGE